jgi:hypothetical protein
MQEFELALARRLGAAICEVDDFSLALPLDGGVRRIDETGRPSDSQ